MRETEKPRSYTMLPDGKYVVNAKELFASERVKKDLAALRDAMARSEDLHPSAKRPGSGSF